MEIGGFDRTYKPRRNMTSQHIDLFLRHVQVKWPDAVFETEVHPNEDERLQPLQVAIKNGCKIPEELFVYQNRAAAESWDKLGCTNENNEQLILAGIEDEAIHFTVGSPDGPTGKLIDEVIAAWVNQPDKF